MKKSGETQRSVVTGRAHLPGDVVFLDSLLSRARRESVNVGVLEKGLEWPRREIESCEEMAKQFRTYAHAGPQGPPPTPDFVVKQYVTTTVAGAVERLQQLRRSSPLGSMLVGENDHGIVAPEAAVGLPCYDPSLFPPGSGVDLGILKPDSQWVIKYQSQVWGEREDAPEFIPHLRQLIDAVVTSDTAESLRENCKAAADGLNTWLAWLKGLASALELCLSSSRSNEDQAWNAVARTEVALQAKENRYRSILESLLSLETLRKRRNMMLFAFLTLLASRGFLHPKIAGVELDMPMWGFNLTLILVTAWFASEFIHGVGSDYRVGRATGRRASRTLQMLQVWLPLAFLVIAAVSSTWCLVEAARGATMNLPVEYDGRTGEQPDEGIEEEPVASGNSLSMSGIVDAGHDSERGPEFAIVSTLVSEADAATESLHDADAGDDVSFYDNSRDLRNMPTSTLSEQRE